MLEYKDIIPEHREHRITLADGRTLAVAEWGDPDGLPYLAFHGTPGGRIGWWKDPDIYRRHGLRRFTIDRPGYGESTRLPGRHVADIVPDVEQALDQLGVDRFVVAGGSGGGPHALACAARLSPRVIRCLAAVSIAPYGVPDLDWMAGMTEGNVVEFTAALEGEAAVRSVCSELRTTVLERLRAGRLDWMGDGYDLSDADLEQMRRHLSRTQAHLVNGLAPGPDGWIDDNLAFAAPWGFEVDDIRVPVLVEYGRTDVLVPPGHGDWLVRHIPGAVAWVDEDAGHLGSDENVEHEHAWLGTGIVPPGAVTDPGG